MTALEIDGSAQPVRDLLYAHAQTFTSKEFIMPARFANRQTFDDNFAPGSVDRMPASCHISTPL